MSEVLFILDNGHGGLNPSTGKYVTPGKRSPKFDDGSTLYEGVNNRINTELIIEGLEAAGMDAIDIVNDWRDIPLNERVRRANELARDNNCVYISIHSDANGNGIHWDNASGIGVYQYTNASSNSVKLATFLRQELNCNFHGIAKDRKIKKANFYVLRKTSCPAVLLELGFHTNFDEAQRMLTFEWREKIVNSIVSACDIYTRNH